MASKKKKGKKRGAGEGGRTPAERALNKKTAKTGDRARRGRRRPDGPVSGSMVSDRGLRELAAGKNTRRTRALAGALAPARGKGTGVKDFDFDKFDRATRKQGAGGGIGAGFLQAGAGARSFGGPGADHS